MGPARGCSLGTPEKSLPSSRTPDKSKEPAEIKIKASGRASPSTCNRFPKGRWGKVALLKGYEKFPKLQFRPLGLEGKLSSGRKSCHRCQGPSLTAPAARDPPPRGVSASAAAARASLRLVPRGRLRLPLSPAARGEVTPLNVSAARGGAGKWLPVCTLRSSSSSTASPPPPGAAVPGDGVARVRAARREGVTARGGGGSRARLGAERVDALREVPVLGAATARDGGRGEAAKATPKLQEHFAPLHCWRPRIELPHFKAAGFRRLGETCPNEATPKTGSATPPQHRRAFGSRPFPLPTLTPTSCAVT
ncbi:uncharacterized protein LOC106509481 [Sus scrofa]|uniref:uncharacterized protein LOC106509481 n=1 Tax=Sus scrofa TaxID=9823 RepID=UPI000A2B62E6|nr:uncharacterized protein LOC106509481 [Sus scrofa]